MKHQISIIIPVYNEVARIGVLIDYLKQNASTENIADLIVVDGGSTDGSQNSIAKLENTALIPSKKGRAKQMNCGAKQATGNILYFLHADSFPPKHFDQYIIKAVENNNSAGCFIMRFNSKHWWLKLAGFLTQLPFKSCRGGDQSLFVTKSLFNTIGGFDESYTIYEDNDFISKLYARKQFVVIKKWLTTSARHYNSHGVWRLQYHFGVIHLKKWLGASPDKLHAYYLKHVNVKK